MRDDDWDVEVEVAELLVATHRRADAALDPAVLEVLALLRDKMKMEAVFVRAYRPLDPQSQETLNGPRKPDPLERAWGEQMVSERLAVSEIAAGIHQNAPVVLASGNIYGTLCAFSRGEWSAQVDLKTLKSSAGLIAQKIDRAHRSASNPPVPHWGGAVSKQARPTFYDSTRP